MVMIASVQNAAHSWGLEIARSEGRLAAFHLASGSLLVPTAGISAAARVKHLHPARDHLQDLVVRGCVDLLGAR
jgi:hypothetical protein